MKALIYCGGDLVGEDLLPDPGGFDRIVAADSGAAQARGGRIDVLVGDMDSVAPADRSALATAGGTEQVHPTAKDLTDLEVAFAAVEDADEIIIVGGGGGRLDHLLGNVGVICAERKATVEWITGTEHAFVIRGTRSVTVEPGATVSLIPVGGHAEGVDLTGCRWTLSGESLSAFAARGVSNVAEESEITVRVETGVVLLCVQA